MIYDGLIEMRKAGMNLTSLVFVNMISSSFLIQLIMNKLLGNVAENKKFPMVSPRSIYEFI